MGTSVVLPAVINNIYSQIFLHQVDRQPARSSILGSQTLRNYSIMDGIRIRADSCPFGQPDFQGKSESGIFRLLTSHIVPDQCLKQTNTHQYQYRRKWNSAHNHCGLNCSQSTGKQ